MAVLNVLQTLQEVSSLHEDTDPDICMFAFLTVLGNIELWNFA